MEKQILKEESIEQQIQNKEKRLKEVKIGRASCRERV